MPSPTHVMCVSALIPLPGLGYPNWIKSYVPICRATRQANRRRWFSVHLKYFNVKTYVEMTVYNTDEFIVVLLHAFAQKIESGYLKLFQQATINQSPRISRRKMKTKTKTKSKDEKLFKA